MAIVQSATTNVVADPATLNFPSAITAGNRIVLITATRKSYDTIAFDAGTWIQRAGIFQTSSDAIPGGERGISIHELIVPSTDFNSSSFTVDFSGGGEADGADVMVHAFEESEGADYVFQTSITASSGASTVTSLNTGNTISVPAGDVFLAVISTHRGGANGTPTWSNAVELFHVQDGTGNNDNHSNSGTLFLTAQPSQAYTDTINIPNARETSVALAVWVKEDGGGTLTETQTDDLTLTENVFFVQDHAVKITNLNEVTETFSAALSINDTTTETLGLTELSAIELGKFVAITETIGIDDFATFIINKSVTEVLNINEQVTIGMLVGLGIVDPLSINENFSISLSNNNSENIAEQLGISETFTVTGTFGSGVMASLVDQAMTWLGGLGYTDGTIQDRQYNFLLDEYTSAFGAPVASLTSSDLQNALGEKVRFILRQSEFV